MTPPDIIAAAQAAQRKTRVFASVSIAQWKLESGNGAHSPGNDPFGMKPRKGKNDPQQTLMTTEWSKARGYYREPQPFRKFDSIADAFQAHAELLSTAPVYADAMRANSVDGFVRRMAPHYATDPHYADKIIAIIDQSGLRKFDV